MRTISEDELKNMSLGEQIIRMDEILCNIPAHFGSILPLLWSVKLKDIEQTYIFQNHEDKERLAWMFFEFSLQSAYVLSYSGFLNNSIIRTSDGNICWNSIKSQINHNACVQANIVGSRIQFELLMDFLYFSLTGKMINDRSKTRNFMKWIKEKGVTNDLFFFLPYVIACKIHDNKFRTAEVHKGSKLKKSFFRMCDPSEHFGLNDILALQNLLWNISTSIVSILNKERPTSFYWCSMSDFGFDVFDFEGWCSAFTTKDEVKLDEFRVFFDEISKKLMT